MKTRCLLTVAIALTLTVAAMAGDDPFVGTWKLDVTKSKYAPGIKPPQSRIEKITVKDNVLTNISEGVENDGKSSHQELTMILDGKEHGDPNNSNNSFKAVREDSYTITRIVKRGDKTPFFSSQALRGWKNNDANRRPI